MLIYRAVGLYCVAFSINTFQMFRSKRLYSATFSNAYVVDCQENVAIVHGFIKFCAGWTTLAKGREH